MTLKKKRKRKNVPTTDQQRMKSSLNFLNWAQEYSKKIVTITFLIFVISNVFFLILITAEFIRNADLTYIDTYMSEVHLTFRDVIGGYLIKAATENILKIGGSFMESYMRTKSDIMRYSEMNEAGMTYNEENYCENIDES